MSRGALALACTVVLLSMGSSCDESSYGSPSSPGKAPVLTSITPSQAAVGDSITLKGSGFSAKNTGVKIGTGYMNLVSVAGDTSLTFNLPPALSACPPGTEACIALAIVVKEGVYPVSAVSANGTSSSLPLQVVER